MGYTLTHIRLGYAKEIRGRIIYEGCPSKTITLTDVTVWVEVEKQHTTDNNLKLIDKSELKS